MRLTFVGTRGGIEKRSRRHHRHAALLVAERSRRVLVDCGGDWLGRYEALRPDAIVLTHAHPDHARGLSAGAPCPVYDTGETRARLSGYPIDRRELLPLWTPTRLGGVVFEAFELEHSRLAPAVGYRITADGACAFYAPDVAAIRDLGAALAGVGVYIGDGVTVSRPMLRRREGRVIGHAPIRAQLAWRQACGVARAIFTHCGSQIVGGDGRSLGALVRRLGRERGVDARIAFDGLSLEIGALVGGWGGI